MRSILITIFTTMVGTLFGWILAQIKLGTIKVLLKDTIETVNYRDDEMGAVSPHCNGKFENLRLDYRLLITNTKQINVALRDFQAVFYSKNGKEIEAIPLKDASTMTYHSYGIDAKASQCVIVGAESSIDVNMFCFLSDYKHVKEIGSVKIKYLNSRLREKYCKVEKLDYSKLEEYRTQEDV